MKVPILRLGDILLTSIQVELTDQETLDFQADVLRMAKETGAKGIIIDITAMTVVDSYTARVLNETATMAKLLGAPVVICGIQPAVAMALVEMGRGFAGVETALNLDHAMWKLHRLIREEREEPST